MLAALGITGLVLIQQGKGADMGASFGSGASQTIFGSAGSGNALTKSTAWLAIIFFVTSMGLAMIARQQADQSIQNNSLIENVEQLDTLLNTQADPTASSDLPQVTPEENLDAALEAVAGALATEGAELQEEVAEFAEETSEQLENAVEEAPAAVEDLPAQ